MPTIDITGREQTDEPDAFLLYHAKSHVTGNRLGDFLGIPHGRECNSQIDYLIRWGSRTGVSYVPNETTFNTQRALRWNTDKLGSLKRLDEAGIPVPDYVEDRDKISDEFGYPALGRSESHTRGEDIDLILQWRDAYLTDDNDYFVEYIPTELEYRMHVVNGEVVKVHEKRLKKEANNHPFIRNHETGWIFLEPRDDPPPDQLAIDAVGAMGMDFGAVDIIRAEEDGQCYVLEVNSAPSLDEANLKRYGEKFADEIGLNDYPGLEAVEWDDEEDEEVEEQTDDQDERNVAEIFG